MLKPIVLHMTLDVREIARFDFENPIFLQFEVDQLNSLNICQQWTSCGHKNLVHQFCESIHTSLGNLPVFHSKKDSEYWNILRVQVDGQDLYITVMYVVSKLHTLVQSLNRVAQSKDHDKYLFIPIFYRIKSPTHFNKVHNFFKQVFKTTFSTRGGKDK